MIDDQTLRAWFVREVLPLERSLTVFVRKYCRLDSEVLDRRQEIYERVLLGCRAGLPLQAAPFVFSVARNHLINCAKRARIVSFESVADLENIAGSMETLTPERHADAREEIQRLMLGLEQLPPRCREVVWLRKVDGLSTREVATRMGVTDQYGRTTNDARNARARGFHERRSRQGAASEHSRGSRREHRRMSKAADVEARAAALRHAAFRAGVARGGRTRIRAVARSNRWLTRRRSGDWSMAGREQIGSRRCAKGLS